LGRLAVSCMGFGFEEEDHSEEPLPVTSIEYMSREVCFESGKFKRIR